MSCASPDEPCPFNDMEIIRFVVSGAYTDSSYTAVDPTTMFEEPGGEHQLDKIRTIEHIVKQLNLDGCDEAGLAWRLYVR
ncbi:MAG: hypothetical protein GY841_05355, partial [FCB group bacterium]|nr:hypothetical protein [FCB group bacterium]